MSHDQTHQHLSHRPMNLIHDDAHHARTDRRTALRFGTMGIGALLIAACRSNTNSTTVGVNTSTPSVDAPAATTLGTSTDVLPGFDKFIESVKVIRQGDFWLVESSGMPAHEMMVGITSWQQQIPVPQPYFGANAWTIPAKPVLASAPLSAKTNLYRGAIALAVNGIPIFNALNNRGDDAYLAGELDEWGGHAGRADDYHYHVAPLHLESIVGPSAPIAYALDGFAIYGSAEPDGSTLLALDEFNGHMGTDETYHYHGTLTYPYINGGMMGVVSVVEGQLDPQPITRGFRPDGAPLSGAVITDFEVIDNSQFKLRYVINEAEYRVNYEINGDEVTIVFVDPAGTNRSETYTRRSS